MTSKDFPKSHRLRKRSQFLSLGKNSSAFHGKVLFIVYKRTELSFARLGITVTKKYGDSHVRNRFKRLVREAFRLHVPSELGVDLDVKPRGKIAFTPTFNDVVADLVAFFQKFIT